MIYNDNTNNNHDNTTNNNNIVILVCSASSPKPKVGRLTLPRGSAVAVVLPVGRGPCLLSLGLGFRV